MGVQEIANYIVRVSLLFHQVTKRESFSHVGKTLCAMLGHDALPDRFSSWDAFFIHCICHGMHEEEDLISVERFLEKIIFEERGPPREKMSLTASDKKMEYCTKQELDELKADWNRLVCRHNEKEMSKDESERTQAVAKKFQKLFYSGFWDETKTRSGVPRYIVTLGNGFDDMYLLERGSYANVIAMLRATDLIPPPLVDYTPDGQPLNERVFWLFHTAYEARLLDAPIRLVPLLGVMGRADYITKRIEITQACIIDDIVNGNVPEENLLLIKTLLEKYLAN